MSKVIIIASLSQEDKIKKVADSYKKNRSYCRLSNTATRQRIQ